MRFSLQSAFILHRRSYRESSLIIDFFTRNGGRISAVARGVRTLRSPLRSILQPFIPLLISWQGKNELMTLTSSEREDTPIHLKEKNLFCAFYLNELLAKTLPKHDPHPNLYSFYYKTLLELQHQDFQQKTLRLFEKKLLEELGYGLQFQYEIKKQKPIVAEQKYYFYPDQGFQEISLNSSLELLGRREWIFSGSSLLSFAAGELNDQTSLLEAKRLMRLALLPLLGNQSLHSRKLFFGVETE